MSCRHTLLTLLTLASTHALAADPPSLGDAAYPATIELQVDATDLDRHILRAHERIPVTGGGPLRLSIPKWIPGHHGPTGRPDLLAGIQITSAGRAVPWRRDPLDVYTFEVDVPAGATSLDLDFESLSPVTGSSGRVVMTPEMLDLQWNDVLLYPTDYADTRIAFQPSLRLPEAWPFASALETAGQEGARIDFKPVSLEMLIDSPVYAGRRWLRVDLDPDAGANGRAPVHLDVMVDNPAELSLTTEQLAAHRALVQQADRLFGARHFAHYDFLLAISQQLGSIGLEHHQSSENGVGWNYFGDWAKTSAGRDLLAHEYTHSWNGKFRRPADLRTANPNQPMQDTLLWVYEGQTQFWGNVLAARSGLVPLADARDNLARVAATASGQSGRDWRNLQDTTNAPVMGRGRPDWPDYQRGSDYYDEMALVWLEADMRIRDASGGARTLDDFARAFFGPQPGRRDADTAPLTYRFEDVVAALERVAPGPWSDFLRERLDRHDSDHLLDGLERAGWRLAWSETPNTIMQGRALRAHVDDFAFSLGFEVGSDARLTNVRWNSPAFAVGLARGVQLVAIDTLAYTAERLRSALTAAKVSKAPLQLLVRDGDRYRTVSIPYVGGVRYPKLERIEGRPDRLTLVLSPRN